MNHETPCSPSVRHVRASCPLFCLLLQKSWRPAEDVNDTTPRERALKSVSFQESVSVISDSPATMELEENSEMVQVGRSCDRGGEGSVSVTL